MIGEVKKGVVGNRKGGGVQAVRMEMTIFYFSIFLLVCLGRAGEGEKGTGN